MPKGSRWEVNLDGQSEFVGLEEAERFARIEMFRADETEIARRYDMSESGLIEHHRRLANS